MSKPREISWGYVKNVIRQYPGLKEAYEELHRQSLTANYSGMPGGGGSSRTTESIALRQLSPVKQREYDAVRMAIEQTALYTNGRDRLRLAGLIYWEGGHSLEWAATQIPCSTATAKRWNGDFIRTVGEKLGVM